MNSTVSAPSFGAIDFSHQDKAVIAAVSGGSDSMAMLVVLREHLVRLNNAPRLVAVTVDHGLRAESADEAELVGVRCAALGIDHDVVQWAGEKPETGVQAAARAARYTLLADAARRHGATMVVTGHTLDDVTETAAMRVSRGEGRGLSGIAPATLFDRSIWFVRPLLGVRRQALRQMLAEKGVAFVDDPSNENEAFERVRMRKAMREARFTDLVAQVQAAQAKRMAAARAGALLLGDRDFMKAEADEGGAVVAMGRQTEPGFEAALQTVLMMVGRRAHFAAADVLAKAMAVFASGPKGEAVTVQGCRLQRGDGVVLVRREARNRAENPAGFDHLLTSFDYPLAKAWSDRVNLFLPDLPFKVRQY